MSNSGPIEAIEGAVMRIENQIETIGASLGRVEIALTDILIQLDYLRESQ